MFSVLRKNLPLKIFSVILAVFLWAVVSRGRGGELMEISLGIPVELHNLPPDMEVIEMPVERVDVRLSGPRRVVSRVSQLGVTIPLDLMGAAEGETTFEVFTSDIKVPEKVTVTRVSPSSITVVLEKTVRRKVPVSVSLEGMPVEGFMVAETRINPSTIEIKGPKSVLSGIQVLSAVPISVEGSSTNLRGEVGIILPEGGVHTVNRSTVQYEVIIGPGKQKALRSR
ncbi:MAG: hypothetical protein JSV00_06530 [bacterium]|nr:MAG: hypothetical protein JSV00_06530 [bacterium]